MVHDSALVGLAAILCGKVIVETNVFIGPYALIRADEVDKNGDMEPIVIGANPNIQDGVVIHCKAGGGVTIRQGTAIAHGPCAVGDPVFVGFNSTPALSPCVLFCVLQTLNSGHPIFKIVSRSSLQIPGVYFFIRFDLKNKGDWRWQ